MVLYEYAWALHCVLAVWASIRDIAYRGDIESKAYTEVSKKERERERKKIYAWCLETNHYVPPSARRSPTEANALNRRLKRVLSTKRNELEASEDQKQRTNHEGAGAVLRWDGGAIVPSPNLSLAPNLWLQQQYAVVKPADS